jgi:hypothetical protein
MTRLLREHKDEPPASLAGLLVGAANEAGGLDNVTVVVVKLGAMEAGDESSLPDALADATDSGQATSRLDTDPDATQTHTLGMPGGPFVRRGWTWRRRIAAAIAIVLIFVLVTVALDWYARQHGMGHLRLPKRLRAERVEHELDVEPAAKPGKPHVVADERAGVAADAKPGAAPQNEAAEEPPWEESRDE